MSLLMIRKVKDISKKFIELAHQPKKLLDFVKAVDLNLQDNRGYAVMHYLAEIGNADMIRFVVENGASANIVDTHGQLPLHIATKHSHLRAVNFLIKLTRNIDAQDRYGNSALHLAAKHGDIAIVKSLIKADALANTLNEDEATPTELAEQYHHQAIVKYLREHGGVKIMHVFSALLKALKYLDLKRKLFILSFTLITIGWSMFATIKTNGELFPALFTAVGASIGLFIICIEKSYKLVRNNERNEHNK